LANNFALIVPLQRRIDRAHFPFAGVADSTASTQARVVISLPAFFA